MKSEERHQLHTNELAQWIADFPEWIKENRNTVIYVAVLAIVVLVLVYVKYVMPRPAATKEEYEFTQQAQMVEMGKLQVAAAKEQGNAKPELLRSTSENLGKLASQLSDDQAQAYALIKQGEAMRSEVHFGQMDEKASRLQLDKAKQAYDSARKKAGQDTRIAGLAQLGLGLSEEDLGNYETARKLYTELKEDQKYAGTIAHMLAAKRLVTMGDYNSKFTFTELPKMAMPEANQPAAATGPVLKPAPSQPQAPAKAAEANSAAKTK
jgi:hypothetical protein